MPFAQSGITSTPFAQITPPFPGGQVPSSGETLP